VCNPSTCHCEERSDEAIPCQCGTPSCPTVAPSIVRIVAEIALSLRTSQ
jgi:hypothetical protein